MPNTTELDGRRPFATVAVGWNPSGLAIRLIVSGKKQSPWCRRSRIEDSDGLHLWIDTRGVRDVHRASRFCHRFAILPFGGGPEEKDPVRAAVPIPRAQGTPHPRRPDAVHCRSQRLDDGYRLDVYFEADALTGYDPEEHSRLGFNYVVVDREHGQQSLSVDSPVFPFPSDPSLWAGLELIS
ncbi:MAG: hypothetical protein D6741_18955 [Planctomycetota bacterium]|nr:MAG: hypothetical protein D6741_18955 [Planctomycetota bacterium]